MCVHAGNSESLQTSVQTQSIPVSYTLWRLESDLWWFTSPCSYLQCGHERAVRLLREWKKSGRKLGHWVSSLEEIGVVIVSPPVSLLERVVLQTVNPASPMIWIPVPSCDLFLPLLTSTMMPPAIIWWPDVGGRGSHLKWANAYVSPLNLQSCGISKYNFKNLKIV